MYHLTLSLAERQAIDWVGYRYRHGDELFTLLNADCGAIPEDSWDCHIDILYTIPEHIAWKIQEIVEEDQLACFAPELMTKFYEFCDKIV